MLKDWALGRCSASQSEFLATHLELCERCAEAFGSLQNNDALSRLIQHCGPADTDNPDAAPPSVQSLIDYMCLAPRVNADDEGEGDDCSNLLDPPVAADEIGRLGSFRVLKQIGKGGMGIVFRAEDAPLGRPVALKLLRPELAAVPSVQQRFLSEARTTASLKHDHVVVIYEIGVAERQDGHPVSFISMELLEGCSLADWLQRNPEPPLLLAVRFAREIANVLAAAHARNIIHRDIKPGNIWVETVPDSVQAYRIRLLDFGLACTTSSSDRTTTAGTPGYIAPEQSRGESVDHRADLYSLGCILRQLLGGDAPTKSLFRNSGVHPKPLDEQKVIPVRLRHLVRRLLSLQADDRPPSASAVERELLAIERRLIRRRAVRVRLLAATGIVLLSILGALALGFSYGRRGVVEVETGGPIVVVSRGDQEVARLSAENDWKAALPAGHYSATAVEDVAVLEPAQFAVAAGETVKLTIHWVPGGPVSEAWLQHVAALPPDKQVSAVLLKLSELNPGFNGKGEFWTVQGGQITDFRICTDQIADISPIRGIPSLKKLECTGSHATLGKLADLSPLQGMKLNALCCWNNPLSDLTPLQGMQLREFQAEHTQIASIEPLAKMPIGTLTIQNTKVRDLSPVRGMPLWICYIDGSRVTDFTPLTATQVQLLRCDFNPARDESVLKSIKSLVRINSLLAEEFWRKSPKP